MLVWNWLKKNFKLHKKQFLNFQNFSKCFMVILKVQGFPINMGIQKRFWYRFVKVQNEWVVFKNDHFFPKTKRSFLKMIEKRIEKRSFNDRFQKRLTTLLQAVLLLIVFSGTLCILMFWYLKRHIHNTFIVNWEV